MAASTCYLKIIHQDISSVLNYVPCVPSCPTCLGALRVYVFYVLTCLTWLRALRAHVPYVATCFRGFSSYVPFFLYMSYVPSFFTRLTCLHFFYVSNVLPSFFTCLTCPHFLRVLPDSFFICFICLHCFKCFQVLTCFTYLHLSL